MHRIFALSQICWKFLQSPTCSACGLKNTIGDAGSTAPSTAYNADTVYRVAYMPRYIAIWLDVTLEHHRNMAIWLYWGVKSNLFSSILFKMKKKTDIWKI